MRQQPQLSLCVPPSMYSGRGSRRSVDTRKTRGRRIRPHALDISQVPTATPACHAPGGDDTQGWCLHCHSRLALGTTSSLKCVSPSRLMGLPMCLTPCGLKYSRMLVCLSNTGLVRSVAFVSAIVVRCMRNYQVFYCSQHRDSAVVSYFLPF